MTDGEISVKQVGTSIYGQLRDTCTPPVSVKKLHSKVLVIFLIFIKTNLCESFPFLLTSSLQILFSFQKKVY